MIFEILKDTKVGEYRVIMTPVEVATLKDDGHTVLVQKDAGVLAGFSDEQYEQESAGIVETKEEMYERCDLIAKVK